MTRKRVLLGLMLIFSLLAAGIASAREFRRGECIIEEDEVLAGNIFFLCRTLIIDGRIEGNVFGAATRATINGHVTGDVFLLAAELDVTGTLDQDLQFGGPVMRLGPGARLTDADANLISLSLSTTVMEDTVVPGDVISFGYQLIVLGAVEGAVDFWGSALTIEGLVEGDIDANVGDTQSTSVPLRTLLIPFTFDVQLDDPGLRVTETGVINGQLKYTAPSRGDIRGQLANPVRFVFKTGQTPTIPLTEIDEGFGQDLSIYFNRVFNQVVQLGIIGLVAILLIPRSVQTPIRNLQAHLLPSLAVGLLAFLLSFPIVIIAVVLSILLVFLLLFLQLDSMAIIIGVVLGVVDLGGASLFYFVAIFIGRVVVSLALGRFIVRSFISEDGSQRVLVIMLFSGVTLLAVFAALPFIGWVFNAVAVFVGLGAILTSIRRRIRLMRILSPATPGGPPHLGRALPPIPERPEDARHVPPPIWDSSPKRTGAENLPEGFQWWGGDDRPD